MARSCATGCRTGCHDLPSAPVMGRDRQRLNRKCVTPVCPLGSWRARPTTASPNGWKGLVARLTQVPSWVARRGCSYQFSRQHP